MTSSTDFCALFTGKNYGAWEFQFRVFVTGKELWGHIDGSTPAPKDPSELAQWQIKDARVMSWILGSVDPQIMLTLKPFRTSKGMWEFLKKVYNQNNTARRFQLEYEISSYTQGDLSIQEYFSGFQNLWGEFADLVYATVPAASLSAVQAVHEQSKRDQFLMKLRTEFEGTRSSLMNRESSPSLDVCFGELLREEQRLATQTQQNMMTVPAVAYAAHGRGTQQNMRTVPAVATHSRGRGRDIQRVQCFSCKDYGHIASQCSQKFCKYCKKTGHIIKDCPIRPQNRVQERRNYAYQADVDSSLADPPSASNGDQAVLTPEMVQQMIMAAFSALKLQGSGLGEDTREGA